MALISELYVVGSEAWYREYNHVVVETCHLAFFNPFLFEREVVVSPPPLSTTQEGIDQYGIKISPWWWQTKGPWDPKRVSPLTRRINW